MPACGAGWEGRWDGVCWDWIGAGTGEGGRTDGEAALADAGGEGEELLVAVVQPVEGPADRHLFCCVDASRLALMRFRQRWALGYAFLLDRASTPSNTPRAHAYLGEVRDVRLVVLQVVKRRLQRHLHVRVQPLHRHGGQALLVCMYTFVDHQMGQ